MVLTPGMNVPWRRAPANGAQIYKRPGSIANLGAPHESHASGRLHEAASGTELPACTVFLLPEQLLQRTSLSVL